MAPAVNSSGIDSDDPELKKFYYLLYLYYKKKSKSMLGIKGVSFENKFIFMAYLNFGWFLTD